MLTRRSDAGFTLLEAILAVAILGFVGTTVAATYGQTARLSTDLANRYEIAAFAHSTLEEYIYTYPALEHAGIYGDRWRWEVTEEVSEPLRYTDFDDAFLLVDVEIHVSDLVTGREFSLSETMARAPEVTQ